MDLLREKPVNATTCPTMGRPKKTIPTTHVRMYNAMAEQLRTIAFHRKIDIADLQKKLFAGRLRREYMKTLDEIDQKRRQMTDDDV